MKHLLKIVILALVLMSAHGQTNLVEYKMISTTNWYRGPDNMRIVGKLLYNTDVNAGWISLEGDCVAMSSMGYRPPIEITVVAKTDSTNLRLAYAADQIIFNWEINPSQLRVDGGPADGLHKDGAGQIPKGKYVTIKWVVTTTHQSIYVNGQLRYRHDGDYSQIVRRVSVFPANGSTVTVRSMTVKPIPDSTP